MSRIVGWAGRSEAQQMTFKRLVVIVCFYDVLNYKSIELNVICSGLQMRLNRIIFEGLYQYKFSY